MIIRPYFQSNPALSATQAAVRPAGTLATINTGTTNFQYNYSASPKLWAGWVSDSGLGFRVSWWHFDQYSDSPGVNINNPIPPTVAGLGFQSQAFFPNNASAGAVTPPLLVAIGPLVGAPGETPAKLLTTSNFKLDVFDFEATQDFTFAGWKLLASAGIRYAHISQNYTAESSQPNLIGGGVTNSLSANHNFEGGGPTIALDLRRELGNSGFSLYATVRGSAVFGDSHQNAFEQTVFSPPGEPAFVVNSYGNSDRLGVIGIAECDLGIEYGRCIGQTFAFVRHGHHRSILDRRRQRFVARGEHGILRLPDSGRHQLLITTENTEYTEKNTSCPFHKS